MGVRITDRMTPEGRKFMQMLKELGEMEVRVGFQHGRATEKDGTDICDIAAWNELGTEHIPSRPFIRQSVDNNQEKINSFLQERVKALAKGASAETTLKEIGEFQKRLIQEEIKSGDFVPNSEATIRKKKSSHPLIATGDMRQSVNYVIQKKGNEDE